MVVSLQSTKFDAILFERNFDETILQLHKLGYSGVEFGIRDPDKIDVKKLKTVCETNKINIVALGTGQAYIDEGLSFVSPDIEIRKEAVERIKKHIGLAVKLKAKVIIGLIRGKMPLANRRVAMRWIKSAFSESFRSILSGDLKTLQTYYDVKLSGQAEEWSMQLKPINKNMSRAIEKMLFNGTLQHLIRVTTWQRNGDYSVMTFISKQNADASNE